jgi:hypothetical protein
VVLKKKRGKKRPRVVLTTTTGDNGRYKEAKKLRRGRYFTQARKAVFARDDGSTLTCRKGRSAVLRVR